MIKSDTSRLLRRRIFDSVLTFVADFLFLPASRRAAVEALVRGDPTCEGQGGYRCGQHLHPFADITVRINILIMVPL